MTHCLSAIPYPQFDPVLLRLGPVAIRWYGLAYLLAFVLSYWVLLWMSRRQILRIPAEKLSDLVSWLALGVLVGGRTGWWLFYHRYPGHPEPWYEPLAIWHGGMSFHGGLIGVAVVMLLWCRKNRAPFLNLADCAAMVTPMGLFFGRIANFINAELVGRPTSVPWGVIFPGENFPRHPSQIYEAILEGPVLLAIVWMAWKIFRPRPGRIAALFLIAYALIRFAVEFTREPDAQLGFIAFGWLTMGQLLSLILALAGLVVFLLVPRSDPPSVARGTR